VQKSHGCEIANAHIVHYCPRKRPIFSIMWPSPKHVREIFARWRPARSHRWSRRPATPALAVPNLKAPRSRATLQGRPGSYRQMFSNLIAIALSSVLVGAPSGARSLMPGELAVVSSGALVLVTSGRTRRVVTGAGTVSQPAWSPGGKWVAFLQGGSALWAVGADGSGAHRVSPAGGDVSEFSWVRGRKGGDLAFSMSDKTSYASKIYVAAPAAPKLREIGAYSELIDFSVAPSGNALAVSYRQGPPPAGNRPPAWKGVLAVVPLNGVNGGPRRVVYTLPQGGYVLLGPGWWPDGKGLLFWDDPAGSASIAADGLSLDSLDLATGRVSTLATTLTYSNWVSWSPTGKTVAVVSGGNRIIWDSAKHLVLCSVPSVHCHHVPLPSPNSMSLDPTWTPAGSLVYDVAPASTSPGALVPPGPSINGTIPFSERNVEAWYGRMGLHQLGPSGSSGHRLAGAPTGAHDPLALPDGILFVRGAPAGLWYLPTGAPSAERVANGLAVPSQYGNYYGYIPWYEDFAWHA
jgi:hypothetical protein